MNPLTQIKNTRKATQREISLGLDESASWHARFKHSAYIFTGGLDYELTEGDLLAVFAEYGELVDVNLVRDRTTGKSKGFAFLAYEDQRSTVLAVDNLNGAKVANRTIRVEHVENYKKLKEEMDPEGAAADAAAQQQQLAADHRPLAPRWPNDKYSAPEDEDAPQRVAAARDGTNGRAPGVVDPWNDPNSLFNLMAGAGKPKGGGEEAGSGKDKKQHKAKHKKHKDKDKSKKKKHKREGRSRSRSRSSSRSRSRSPPAAAAGPTSGRPAAGFGPPRPPGPPKPAAGDRQPGYPSGDGAPRPLDGHRGGPPPHNKDGSSSRRSPSPGRPGAHQGRSSSRQQDEDRYHSSGSGRRPEEDRDGHRGGDRSSREHGHPANGDRSSSRGWRDEHSERQQKHQRDRSRSRSRGRGREEDRERHRGADGRDGGYSRSGQYR